jgi:ketopantoate reductase
VSSFVGLRATGGGAGSAEVGCRLERCDRLPYEMKSSMLEDLALGRRLELPWLSGALVHLGQELSVPTPTHALITTALKLHADGRGGSEFDSLLAIPGPSF